MITCSRGFLIILTLVHPTIKMRTCLKNLLFFEIRKLAKCTYYVKCLLGKFLEFKLTYLNDEEKFSLSDITISGLPHSSQLSGSFSFFIHTPLHLVIQYPIHPNCLVHFIFHSYIFILSHPILHSSKLSGSFYFSFIHIYT